MKLLTKNIVVYTIAGCLLLLLAVVLYPVHGVPVLAYHKVNNDKSMYSVSPLEFEQQMRYLSEQGYTAISLHEYAQAMRQQQPLPAKPIVLTFDDGYENNYTTALPIMEKYGMRGTVFIISGYVTFPEYLTWEQIRAMQARGTEIGSHTFSHVNLGTLSPEEQEYQLAESKREIEYRLQQPVEFLAYPFGGFTSDTQQALKKLGYWGACTGEAGLNQDLAAPYTLKRINVPKPKFGLLEFRLRLLRAEIISKLGL